MCQIGTAMAARTDHASLRRVGLFSNPLLLMDIAFEVAFTAALVRTPPPQAVFGTAPPPANILGLLLAFPFLVSGPDAIPPVPPTQPRRIPGGAGPWRPGRGCHRAGEHGHAAGDEGPFLASAARAPGLVHGRSDDQGGDDDRHCQQGGVHGGLPCQRSVVSARW
ncbi:MULTISPECIES: cation-translocating P-type ATPase C-terminal domain-containing protein [unclassified Streptomyces]|uniref:cation-translocating P-type ATPase C-terminal domain-containing protein n=1 Tax=unclassified Streptomyces TaxID=2593676 RepID=UPI002DDBF949|nr:MULTISPECIES: cation-translocating P-type ATPase C-terminal domain-containing protein [unclassified Streptomyces]